MRRAVFVAVGALALAAGCSGNGGHGGAANIKNLTDNNFQNEIAQGVTLVEFWMPG